MMWSVASGHFNNKKYTLIVFWAMHPQIGLQSVKQKN